jgi:hypothetical protein
MLIKERHEGRDRFHCQTGFVRWTKDSELRSVNTACRDGWVVTFDIVLLLGDDVKPARNAFIPAGRGNCTAADTLRRVDKVEVLDKNMSWEINQNPPRLNVSNCQPQSIITSINSVL